MGENPRFEALGHRHPKQGCYVIHSEHCVKLAAHLGLDCGEAAASAAAILGATGVDTTMTSPKGKGKQASEAPLPPKPVADDRTAMERLIEACPGVAEALRNLLAPTHRKMIGAINGTSPRVLTRAMDKSVTRASTLVAARMSRLFIVSTNLARGSTSVWQTGLARVT